MTKTTIPRFDASRNKTLTKSTLYRHLYKNESKNTCLLVSKYVKNHGACFPVLLYVTNLTPYFFTCLWLFLFVKRYNAKIQPIYIFLFQVLPPRPDQAGPVPGRIQLSVPVPEVKTTLGRPLRKHVAVALAARSCWRRHRAILLINYFILFDDPPVYKEACDTVNKSVRHLSTKSTTLFF